MTTLTSVRTALSERRWHPRIDFKCPLRWNDGGADRMGWTRNASETGLNFLTRAISAPVRGQRIAVNLEFDESHDCLLDSDATVVRCDPCGDGLCTVGLRLSQPFGGD